MHASVCKVKTRLAHTHGDTRQGSLRICIFKIKSKGNTGQDDAFESHFSGYDLKLNYSTDDLLRLHISWSGLKLP